MTYYGGKEMAASFRLVRSNTVQVAEDLPEEQYGFRAAEGTRSVGETLTHIALSSRLQQGMHTSRVTDLGQVDFGALVMPLRTEEAKPRTKAEILALLKAEGESFATYLEGLSDAFLAESVAMPSGAQPATKSRFEMLLTPKEHEMHHRGQLMLVERMLGLVPHLTRLMQERMAQQQAQAK